MVHRNRKSSCACNRRAGTALMVAVLLAVLSGHAWGQGCVPRAKDCRPERSMVVAPARICEMPVLPAKMCTAVVAPPSCAEMPVAPSKICAQVVAPVRICEYPVVPAKICAYPVAPQRVCEMPVMPRKSCTVWVQQKPAAPTKCPPLKNR
jgi:hypothetical protein